MEQTFLERLKIEKQELIQKVTKLALFIAKENSNQSISEANFLLLKQQLVHMNDYLNILIIRIELIEKK